MSKRFRDTGLWDKDWYIQLSCAERSALDFIFSRCDAVGTWTPVPCTVEKLIGERVDWETLPGKVNGNIDVLDNGRWWLVDFVDFQYGASTIGPESKGVRLSVYSLLLRLGLWERFSGSRRVELPKRYPKRKKEEGILEGESEGEKYAEGVRMKPEVYSALVAQYGKTTVDLAIQKVSAQQIKTGKKYANPRGAILQWGIRAALEEIKKSGAPKTTAADYCSECGVAGGNHGAFCPRKPA